jgi:hypothetical protein
MGALRKATVKFENQVFEVEATWPDPEAGPIQDERAICVVRLRRADDFERTARLSLKGIVMAGLEHDEVANEEDDGIFAFYLAQLPALMRLTPQSDGKLAGILNTSEEECFHHMFTREADASIRAHLELYRRRVADRGATSL